MLPDSLLGLILEHVPRSKRQRPKPELAAADFYVSNLPGLPQDSKLKLFAGHLPAYTESIGPNDPDPHLFFLLARALHPDGNRMIIWFNGGPGCSSLDGAFMEIGPLRVVISNSTLQLAQQPHPWNEYADLLFIDQPAGTGFSYITRGTPVAELPTAAAQVVQFLINFYKIFPEYSFSQTYLAGESYAGQFIPYTADAMMKASALHAPLKGLIMGNAWIDPMRQYPAYLQFAFKSGLLRKGSKEAENAVEQDLKCNATLATALGKDHVLVRDCERMIDLIFPDHNDVDGVRQCTSAYNIELVTACDLEYPPASARTTRYLDQPSVVSALHAEAKGGKWAQCNDTVGSQMWSFESKPAIALFPTLLEKLDILLFAGELDAICNWLGIENSIQALSWRGSTGLGNVTTQNWSINGSSVGSWTASRGVHWVRYTKASHMVALEEPLAMQDMLIRFTGIDVLAAAGSSARIPSKLGGEKEAILGITHPNGTTLHQMNNSLPETKSEEEMLTEAAAKEETREAYYGPRRSATLTLVLFTVLTIFCLFVKWISGKRRTNMWIDRAFDEKPIKQKQRRREPSRREKRSTAEQDSKDVELENLIRGDEII